MGRQVRHRATGCGMISVMTVLGDHGTDLVAAMADVVTEQATASEEARTLTAPIVDAMWASGLDVVRATLPRQAASSRGSPR